MKNIINNDVKCIVYSILINGLIIFSIPHMKNNTNKENRIRIGIRRVDVFNDNTKKDGKTSLSKKNKKSDKTVHETKYKDRKNQLFALKGNENKKQLTTKIQEPHKIDNNLISTTQTSENKVAQKEKEELGVDNIKNVFIDEESQIDKESVAIEHQKEQERNEDLSIKKRNLNKTLENINGVNGKNDENLGNKKDSNGVKDKKQHDGIVGLPKGYELGVDEGLNVIWDVRNKDPKYPETAELRGMQGKIKLRLKIDKNGRVIDVVIEKGSGVPEINQVTEEVARTWIIKLIKNGMNVEGNAIVEYTFKLKGASN